VINKRAKIESYEKDEEAKYKVSFSFQGQRVRKQGFLTKKAAQVWADASLEALIKGSFQTSSERRLEERTRQEEAVTLSDVYEHMVGVSYYHRIAETTRYNKSKRWAKWIAPNLGSRNARSIDKAMIRRLVAKMMQAGVKNQSINNYIWDVNALLRDAEEEFGIETQQPFKALKFRQKKRNYLEAQEIKNLLDSTNSVYYRNAFGLLVGLGLRIGEATVLNWSQVDFENRVVNIDRAGFYSPRLGKVVVGLPKYGRQAAMPMTDLVQGYLESQLELTGDNPAGYVFPAKSNRLHPSAPSAWTEHLQRSLKWAGITKKIGLHDLRRSAITLLALAGVPLTVISHWARHSHMQTTVRSYIAFDQKRAFEEIKNLGTWNELELALNGQRTDENRSTDDD